MQQQQVLVINRFGLGITQQEVEQQKRESMNRFKNGIYKIKTDIEEHCLIVEDENDLSTIYLNDEPITSDLFEFDVLKKHFGIEFLNYDLHNNFIYIFKLLNNEKVCLIFNTDCYESKIYSTEELKNKCDKKELLHCSTFTEKEIDEEYSSLQKTINNFK